MALPLMPKATAVWLVEHTALTFEQIADFTGMHELEIQAIADDEVAIGIVGLDPVAGGQITAQELKRVEADPDARLHLTVTDVPRPQNRARGARYTPVSKRGDRPDAIAWVLKNHPELTDAQVCKLLGTTKPTINTIRDKSHWNASNIKPRNPVTLGLCSEADLEKEVILAAPRRPASAVVVEAPVAEAIKPPAPAAIPSFLADAFTRRPAGGAHSED